ncbi:MAG: hypothetical protein ABJB76_11315 [Candidatus Nitrosocosmicus sp.]
MTIVIYRYIRSCKPLKQFFTYFLTREEKMELLKEYQKRLENESQGVPERIKEFEVN